MAQRRLPDAAGPDSQYGTLVPPHSTPETWVSIARARLSAANFTLRHQVLSVFARELTLSMIYAEQRVPVRGADVPASRQCLRSVRRIACHAWSARSSLRRVSHSKMN